MSDYVLCVMCGICGILFGLCIGINTDITRMEQQAIEHHAAQYNATTGEFEWLK